MREGIMSQAREQCVQTGNGKSLTTGLKICYLALAITVLAVFALHVPLWGELSLLGYLLRAFLALETVLIMGMHLAILTMIKDFR
jgi:hypothetical protein